MTHGEEAKPQTRPEHSVESHSNIPAWFEVVSEVLGVPMIFERGG